MTKWVQDKEGFHLRKSFGMTIDKWAVFGACLFILFIFACLAMGGME